MIVTIKKDDPASEIGKGMKAIAKERATRRGLDAKKYAGRIKFPVDGITYQKQIRSEWE